MKRAYQRGLRKLGNMDNDSPLYEEESSRPLVLVLLSVFNGEIWLQELVNSVFSQIGVDVFLLVRDDGSTDDGITRICNLNNMNRIEIECGPNLGASESFFELLKRSRDIDCDYIAFCDQDDIWLPNKLLSAIQELTDRGKFFYCSSRKWFLEANGTTKTGVFPRGKILPSFENSMVENIAAGCTIVMPKNFVLSKVLTNLPDGHVQYDAWLYMLAATFDQVAYDQEPHIMYRLHEKNDVGIPGKFTRKVQTIREDWSRKLELLDLFIENWPAGAPNEKLRTAKDFQENRSFIRRIAFVFRVPRLRQSRFDDLILKAALVFNLL